MAASVFASDDYYGVPYSASDATQSGASGNGSTFHITADEPAFVQLSLDLKKLSAMPTLPEPGTGITPWINSDNKAIDANGNLTGEEVVVTPADNLRGLAKILGMGEGNYESYNSGTDRKSGRVLHGAVNNPKGTVTGKTINQILASSSRPATDTTRMFAVGAYQIIPNTLKGAMTALGLTGNERFTPDLQDRIFRDYLIKQGGGALANLVVNGEGTVDAAQYSAAKTWASIATPAGDRVGKNAGSYVSDGTDSYYEGPANHANMKATNALRSHLSAFLPR